jgi:hypothetical protein
MKRGQRVFQKTMHRLLLCVVAVVGFTAAVKPAAADELIATTTRPTPLSAYGGRLVWSNYDAATHEYALMTNALGVTAAVPVRSRSVPFDVDLGPDDRTFHIVAVYSRCRQDPPLRRNPAIGNVIAQMPDWARGRRCVIYKFDFETGREIRVASTSAPGASEFLPSIWNGRIAFARVRERRKGQAGSHPHIYLQPGHRKARRVPGGARSKQRFCTGKPRRCRALVEPGPTAIDLRGTRLVFVWDSGGPSSAAYLDVIGHASNVRRRLLLEGGSGNVQAEEMVSPTIEGGHVLWGFIRFGNDMINQLLRYKTSGGIEEARLPLQAPGDSYLQSILATVVDAPFVFYLASGVTIPGEPCTTQAPCAPYPGCADDGPCKIWRAQMPAFEPFTRR